MADYTRYRTEWANLQYAYSRAWGRPNVIPARMLGSTPAGLNLGSGAWAGSHNAYSPLRFEREMLSLAFQLKQGSLKLPQAMNILAQILARVDQNYSMRMSSGPRDPRAQSQKAAWKIPVRRITGAYFQHWFVRRLAPGVWVVYNPTREAYYIEYGIHTSHRRVRRPIRKMALIKTLKFADKHKVGGYVWEGVFGHLRETSGSSRGRLVVHFSPQSAKIMGML